MKPEKFDEMIDSIIGQLRVMNESPAGTVFSMTLDKWAEAIGALVKLMRLEDEEATDPTASLLHFRDLCRLNAIGIVQLEAFVSMFGAAAVFSGNPVVITKYQESDFSNRVTKRISLIQSVLQAKQKEYATGLDRFYNFKKASVYNHENPLENLWGYLTKHLVSLHKMIEDEQSMVSLTEEHDSVDLVPIHKPETWEEKFGDTINYFILAYGLAEEILGHTDYKAFFPHLQFVSEGKLN